MNATILSEEQKEQILSCNLNALGKRFPGFTKWLEEHKETKHSLSVVPSGSSLWIVGGQERMIDRYGVTDSELRDTKHAIWVVLGLGAGDAFSRLSVEARRHVARVFVLETDPAVWWAALRHQDLSSALGDARFFPLWDREEIRARLFEGSSTLLLLGLWREPLYLRHLGELESREERMAEDFRRIRDHLFVVLRSMGNSAEDTLVGFRQMMMNIPGMMESYDITDLENAYSGYPAIIVGAGPSLDKNYKLLHEVKDRAIIISSDTALRKLLADDIHPHFVVSLERGLIIYQKHFANLPKMPQGTVLFVQSVCVPEMAGTWEGGPFCLGFKWGLPLDHWFSGLTQLPLLRSGASCTHLAYTLALMLGCRKIALIGQDLAYAPDGSTHSRSTAWEGQTKETLNDGQTKYITVPGNLGEDVLTHDVWLLFKRIFEEWYREGKDRYEGFCLYNATEGGAVIDGAETATLRDFIDAHIDGLAPFPQHPKDRLSRKPLQEGDKQTLLHRGFEEALVSVEIMREGFKRLEDAVGDVVKPLLSPQERQKRASLMGKILDEIIAKSSFVTYVYQSHIALMSGDLLRNRSFSTVEDLAEWKGKMAEFVESARSIFDHLELNLNLAKSLLEETPKDTEHIASLGRSWEALDGETALDLWKSAASKDLPLFALRLCAHYDFSRGSWPADDAVVFGRTLLFLGSVERARHILRQASQSDAMSKDAKFWNDLGVAFASYELGVAPDCDNAFGCFNKAFALDPELETVQDNIIACEQIIRKGAMMTLELRNPDYEKGISMVLAESYARLHQWDDALEWYTRAIPRFADGEEIRKAEVFVKIAGCHSKLNRMELAERSYLEAEKVAPEDKRPFYRWELLRHYLRNRERERARESFRALRGTDLGRSILEKNDASLRAFVRERAVRWMDDLLASDGTNKDM